MRNTMRHPFSSVYSWPLWLRVAAVLPALLVLWLAVAWANGPIQP